MHEDHKKKLNVRMFKHNVINFEDTSEGNPNYSKTYFMSIFRHFAGHQN